MSVLFLPFRRVVSARTSWLAVLGASGVALAFASLQHFRVAAHGADRALDIYAAIAVPLLVYGVVQGALGDAGLVGSGRTLVRFGAARGPVALGTVLVAMAASALLCGILGGAVAAWAHGAEDPPAMRDALETFAFGALAGATYAAYFTLASAILPGTWGRGAFLLLDWMLGSGVDVGALFTPHAHVRNLLGGDGPLEMAPWESLIALALMAFIFAALAVRRAMAARV